MNKQRTEDLYRVSISPILRGRSKSSLSFSSFLSLFRETQCPSRLADECVSVLTIRNPIWPISIRVGQKFNHFVKKKSQTRIVKDRRKWKFFIRNNLCRFCIKFRLLPKFLLSKACMVSAEVSTSKCTSCSLTSGVTEISRANAYQRYLTRRQLNFRLQTISIYFLLASLNKVAFAFTSSIDSLGNRRSNQKTEAERHLIKK